MSTQATTATGVGPPVMGEFARKVFDQEPAVALELVLAENERIRMESRNNAEVEVSSDGYKVTNLGGIYRLGELYSRSCMVPDAFRGKPADCAIGVQLAMRWGIDPFMLFQKMYVVHGKPSIESQLAIALANAAGVFTTRIAYRMEGTVDSDDRRCVAYATMDDTNQVVEEMVSVAIAKKMGWWAKKDSLWPKMTDLMLKYRAAMWLIRTNAPEVLMGFLSKEEAVDVAAGRVSDTPAAQPRSLDDLADRLATPSTAQPVADPSASAATDDSSGSETTDAGDQFRLLEEYRELITGAESILRTGEIENGARKNPALTQETLERLRELCLEHVEAIRSKRGKGSKKSPPPIDSPEALAEAEADPHSKIPY
ncbi:hypothetical protein LCGC14_0772440 [marine sediment metagenome]|uniref:RecT family protein n=1 Tax=marine sediment metagenome TaxID=412755 RepID=A0A0F9Q235_9ZZZZ